MPWVNLSAAYMGVDGAIHAPILQRYASKLPTVACKYMKENLRGRGIRTPERVTPLTVFKTAAFNHSAIPPTQL